jgi:hypothetical protein
MQSRCPRLGSPVVHRSASMPVSAAANCAAAEREAVLAGAGDRHTQASAQDRKLRRAWANPDADEATRDLEALARQLEKLNPDAAGSLREGLAEMFTVTRLGVTGALLRTVASTNPVESMIEIVRDHARNVQRWKDGDMRLRWAAAGMLAAAGQFRRVQGYAQLPQLAGALAQVTASCSQPIPENLVACRSVELGP